MPDRPTILLSFAHPDDESFLVAGTVARSIAEHDARVVLVTATVGEAATLHPGARHTREELGAVRERELHHAARVLGIEPVYVLGHRDRHLAEADALLVRRQLVRAIRAHRPDIVITFDPNGSNLHPDHIAISRFTADAVSAAADARWHPEEGEAHAVPRLLWTGAEPLWLVLRDIDTPDAMAARPGVDYLVDVSGYRDRKREALLAHESQRRGIDRIFFQPGHEARTLAVEVFRDAWPDGIRRAPRRSIFDGLR